MEMLIRAFGLEIRSDENVTMLLSVRHSLACLPGSLLTRLTLRIIQAAGLDVRHVGR